MKKVSALKTNKRSYPAKQSNMRVGPGEQDGRKVLGFPESDCIVESQAEYIENLQQQIFVLENEISHLRACSQESNKQFPSMVAEGERLAKTLADCQNDIKNLKIDVKRKQTTIDLLRSEKGRSQKYMEELEEKVKKDKCKILEELYILQKERDSLLDKNVKLQALAEEKKENERKLQENVDNLEVDFSQVEKEAKCNREIIKGLIENKEQLQKDLLEAKMTIEAQPSNKGDIAVKVLKGNVGNLHEELETLKRSFEHEHLLRERLSQDNAELIKRHADIESQFAEVKALLREEESLRSSLEQVHLSTILEASEAKGRDASLHEKIEDLMGRLKEESDRTRALSRQLVDEQRFKMREEEKLSNLQERYDQREDAAKALKKENIGCLRDLAYLNDQLLHLKQQSQNKDEEVLGYKQKVQEMQVYVEEFIQNSQAANRQNGERWKQLKQLAQSIQAITCADEPTS